MKKILTASALFLFLVIFFPRAANAQGTYFCAWTGVCYTDIAGSTGPYTCPANYGHCSAGDLGCTPCEDLTSMESCLDTNPRQCIEQNPTTGYYCAGTTFQCQPCFEQSTNYGCNPPQYSSQASCDSVCKGQVSIKYRCLNGECMEAENGPYESMAECSVGCGEQELYCDSSGNPTSDSSSNKLYTAIGCIPMGDTNEFIGFILRWAIGIGGGIAFLLIVFAGFQIMTSAGNPERLQAGKELLTSAIAGLILLVFSVFILRIIGVNILGIFKP